MPGSWARINLLIFFTSSFACLARCFLLLAQEKVPKEKGTRCTHRLTPMPCVPRQSGGAQNSLRSNSCAPDPRLSAVLGECRRVWGGGLEFHVPSGAAEHRSEVRMTLAPCLSVSELRERRTSREAQGTRVAGQPPGSPFFWYFSLAKQRKVQELLGKQEKVPRPAGRNLRIKKGIIRSDEINGKIHQ